MNHMMIDLETLATSANALVVSVGAAVFNEKEILRTGYWVLDPQDQVRTGRGFAFKTIKWWMEQSDEARAVFKDQNVTTLRLFASEFQNLFGGEPHRLWGNGADFDLAIMIDLWQRSGLPLIREWKYSNHMCYRTFKTLFLREANGKLVERKGTHHNALDDAIFQAENVIASGRLSEFKC